MIFAAQSLAPQLPVLYTVGQQATLENMNFNVWAVWAGRAVMENFFNNYTANFSPIKSVGDPRVAKHTL